MARPGRRTTGGGGGGGVVALVRCWRLAPTVTLRATSTMWMVQGHADAREVHHCERGARGDVTVGTLVHREQTV